MKAATLKTLSTDRGSVTLHGTSDRARTFGVNLDGEPIGTISRVRGQEFNVRLYMEQCPWDCFGGVFGSRDEAFQRVADHGRVQDFTRTV